MTSPRFQPGDLVLARAVVVRVGGGGAFALVDARPRGDGLQLEPGWFAVSELDPVADSSPAEMAEVGEGVVGALRKLIIACDVVDYITSIDVRDRLKQAREALAAYDRQGAGEGRTEPAKDSVA